MSKKQTVTRPDVATSAARIPLASHRPGRVNARRGGQRTAPRHKNARVTLSESFRPRGVDQCVMDTANEARANDFGMTVEEFSRTGMIDERHGWMDAPSLHLPGGKRDPNSFARAPGLKHRDVVPLIDALVAEGVIKEQDILFHSPDELLDLACLYL